MRCRPWCPARWSVPVGATALALDGDAVVLATGTGDVRVLDAATGTARASALVDFGATSLAVDGGTIVARAPTRLWVFGSCTTTECPPTWKSSVQAFGQPVVADELVYVNSAPGSDPPEGSTLDVYRLDGCGRLHICRRSLVGLRGLLRINRLRGCLLRRLWRRLRLRRLGDGGGNLRTRQIRHRLR